MQRLFTTAIVAAFCVTGAFAQQEKGDKEIGIGGQLYYQGSNGFETGNLSAQFSFGVFATTKNYFGFEADPTLTITGQKCSTMNPCITFSQSGQAQEATGGSTTNTNLGG